MHVFSPARFLSECQIDTDQDPNCLQNSLAYDEIRHWGLVKYLSNIALITSGLAGIEKANNLIQLPKLFRKGIKIELSLRYPRFEVDKF